MELDYIIVSRLLLHQVAKGLLKNWFQLIYLNSSWLYCVLLPCVHDFETSCQWFVTTVLTLPTHVLQHHRIFCIDSEAILSRISGLCPGGQTFLSETYLKDFTNQIHLVKVI